MQNRQNIDPQKVSELLKKLKIDPASSDSKAMEQAVEKSLSPEQSALFHSILADREKTQQIMDSPQAKKLMNLLFKEK